MEHIVTSKLRSKPEWFNWGLQKSSLNSAPIEEREFAACFCNLH